MKLQRLVAVLAMTLCTFSAKADLFTFSWNFGGIANVSGSFEGTANGQYIENVSNVSATFVSNVLPTIGPLNLNAFGYEQSSHLFSNTVLPVVSFDPYLSNFVFVNSNAPTVFDGTTNYFYILNDDPYNNHRGGFATDSGFNIYGGIQYSPGAWSVVAAPIPEPETYALMIAGLGLLGIQARRRKLKLATASRPAITPS